MISINGMQINSVNGGSISVNGNKIFVDGKDVTPDAKNIEIVVKGDLGELSCDACDKISVGGNVKGDVKTMSGDVRCNDVSGNVKTMSGDVSAKQIHGSTNTMSGDINT